MDPEFLLLLRTQCQYAGDAPITEKSQLRTLGLDSMRSIELLFALEDAYGITIPDDQLVDSTFETAGGLWSVVFAQMSEPLGEESA